jgi:hypothetical protein
MVSVGEREDDTLPALALFTPTPANYTNTRQSHAYRSHQNFIHFHNNSPQHNIDYDALFHPLRESLDKTRATESPLNLSGFREWSVDP